MDWALTVLLVVAVVSMIAVPYFRAVPNSSAAGSASGKLSARDAIEEALRQRYCLACGTPYDQPSRAACQNCGAAREGVPS